MSGVKFLVIDSHDLHWRRACGALDADPRFGVVYVVDSVDHALNCMRAVDPDVVMVDITLPGALAMNAWSRVLDGAGRAVLIAAAETVDDSSLSLAISLGARACVPRDISPSRLASVISEVAEGRLPLEREIARRPVLLGGLLTEFQRRLRHTPDHLAPNPGPQESVCPLTDRERMILALVADGEANKEVAVILDISERTVKNHMANILEKLPARSRAHAVRLAVEGGWLSQRCVDSEPVELELAA